MGSYSSKMLVFSSKEQTFILFYHPGKGYQFFHGFSGNLIIPVPERICILILSN
jgi:hypothetical protein